MDISGLEPQVKELGLGISATPRPLWHSGNSKQMFGMVSRPTGSLVLGMPSLLLISAVCKQCRDGATLQMIPSCSPFNLLTRFCSQSSRSFAANFCKKINIKF